MIEVILNVLIKTKSLFFLFFIAEKVPNKRYLKTEKELFKGISYLFKVF